MFSSVERVLVLAPHTDDAELGAGGTIARLIEASMTVHCVAFSIAEESVPAGFASDVLATEVVHASKALGVDPNNVSTFRFPVRRFPSVRQEILEEMIRLRRTIDPQLVLAPASSDVHQDHQVVSAEAIRAFKNRKILGYELIWNNLRFDGRLSVKLERRHVARKQAALACYESQAGRAYLSPDFIEGHSRTRGVQCGFEFAEAFEMMRWVAD
jgi:LmbE family N-acetylglucosaminyl deacetylase